MQHALRLALALVAALTASTPFAADKPAAPAAARYYPLVGKWTGAGTLGAPGQPDAPLKLDFQCRKVSGGVGVLCELRGEGKGMNIRETDLFGVDPVTGRGHWFSVTNMGETHDHLTDWPDARTMTAATSWTQEGKQMREDITMRFTGAKSFEFRGVVTQDGKEVGSFTGKLKR